MLLRYKKLHLLTSSYENGLSIASETTTGYFLVCRLSLKQGHEKLACSFELPTGRSHHFVVRKTVVGGLLLLFPPRKRLHPPFFFAAKHADPLYSLLRRLDIYNHHCKDPCLC